MSPRKWVKATALILAAFALCYVIARPTLESYLLSHPRRWVAELTAADAGVPVDRVTFRATDGLELAGWFVHGTGSGATIVISHGSGANGPGAYPWAAFLVRAGYHVFVFDHRAHGQSQGRATTLGPLEVRDLRGAVDYVRGRPDVDPGRVGVMGCSMGAGVSIGAAAKDPAIRAVVVDSVYADMGELWARFGYVGIRGTSLHMSWGVPMRWATWLWTGQHVAEFKPEALIAQIGPRPVLIIHGELDNAACTVADARRLYRAAKEPKELWIVPGAAHCGARWTAEPEYIARVTRFFDQALGP